MAAREEEKSGVAGCKRDATAAALLEAVQDSGFESGALSASSMRPALVVGDGVAKDKDRDKEENEDENEAPANNVSGKRSSSSLTPVVAPLDRLVAVPEISRTTFDSWEDFHSCLQEYGQQTHQLYSVRSATPSSRRNSLMAEKHPKQPQLLIPPEFAHYVKTITCTHGGKPRRRSTGARPNHQHRAIQCPAQINACVKQEGGTWRVYVTNQNAWHNHEVTEALYRSYPEVRNALGAEVLATVNILRKAEAKRRKILEYIIENTEHTPKMKDVHNLLSKMKRADQASS